MTQFDAYGNRVIYVSRSRPKFTIPVIDLSLRTPPRRYLVWILYSPNDGVGMRRSYRTRVWAVRAAKRLVLRGYGAEVSDRKIRPGSSGFLASREGSYLMRTDGTLIIGTFAEIEALRCSES